MLALLKLWKVALGLLLGLALGWFVMVPTARENGRAAGHAAGNAAGIMEERVVHEEARRKAEAQADQDRRAAQVRIDAIERVYHERTAEQSAQLDILEASIFKETSRAQAPTQALPQAGGGACPAAVPRGLRDALARVGAGAAGDHPAGAAPALR